MENNQGSKAKGFLQKMYHFRVKVDKQGKPIVNVSSIFGLACLLFAPHMTIVGVLASLLLGYQIRFESEDMDDAELEERIRRAAQNVKNGAMTAAKSIQTEISKARSQNASARTQAETEQAAEKIVETAKETAAEPVQQAQEILKDLQSHAAQGMTESNPAATTFHSAYAASAGSVPVLRVNDEPSDTPEPDAPSARGSEG